MAEELFEAKIGIGDFKVNLKEAYRRITKVKEASGSVEVVAQRFRRLFEDHGLKLQHAIDVIPAEFWDNA